MFLVQNINVSQLPHGMAVTDLCFVKPSAYFIQNWECYHAFEILGEDPRAVAYLMSVQLLDKKSIMSMK